MLTAAAEAEVLAFGEAGELLGDVFSLDTLERRTGRAGPGQGGWGGGGQREREVRGYGIDIYCFSSWRGCVEGRGDIFVFAERMRNLFYTVNRHNIMQVFKIFVEPMRDLFYSSTAALS